MPKINKATDETIFEYGKYKGKNTRMIDVPASYLLFIHDNNYTIPAHYKFYIKDNYEALKKEAKKS